MAKKPTPPSYPFLNPAAHPTPLANSNPAAASSSRLTSPSVVDFSNFALLPVSTPDSLMLPEESSMEFGALTLSKPSSKILIEGFVTDLLQRALLSNTLEIFQKTMGDQSDLLIQTYANTARQMLQSGTMHPQEIATDLNTFLSSVQYAQGSVLGEDVLRLLLDANLKHEQTQNLLGKIKPAIALNALYGTAALRYLLMSFVKSRVMAEHCLQEIDEEKCVHIQKVLDGTQDTYDFLQLDTADRNASRFFLWLFKRLNCNQLNERLAKSLFNRTYYYDKSAMEGQLAFAYDMLDILGKQMPKQLQVLMAEFCKHHYQDLQELHLPRPIFCHKPVITTNQLTNDIIAAFGNQLNKSASHLLTQFVDADTLLLWMSHVDQISSDDAFNITSNPFFNPQVAIALLTSPKSNDLKLCSSDWPAIRIQNLLTQTKDPELAMAYHNRNLFEMTR